MPAIDEELVFYIDEILIPVRNKFTPDVSRKSNPTFVERKLSYFHLLSFPKHCGNKILTAIRDISVRRIAQFEVDRLDERSPKAPAQEDLRRELLHVLSTRNHLSISRGTEIRGIVKRLASNEPVWSLTLFITSRCPVGRAFLARHFSYQC